MRVQRTTLAAAAMAAASPVIAQNPVTLTSSRRTGTW